MDKSRRRKLKQQAKKINAEKDYLINQGGYPRFALTLMALEFPNAESLNDSEYLDLVLSRAASAMYPLLESPPLIDVHSCNPEGDSVLHIACSGGDSRAVRLLVEAGVDIESLDDMNNTPLHCAVDGRFLDIVVYLLAHGAQIDVKDAFGYTPLEWAVQIEYQDVAAALKKR